MKLFKILIVLLLLTSCKVHYATNFRVKDLETKKYYYVNSYKQKDSCISFTEYNRNEVQREAKTICNYKIEVND